MIKPTYIIILACIGFIQINACTKETQISEGNPVPTITLVKAWPIEITQFKDSLTVTVGYEDGDGDLGFENADINSLEIKDARLSKPDYYYVAPQAPLNSKIHIKGTLNIQIKNMFLLGSGAIETTNLEIRLKDRAGNWSNKLTTATLNIKK
jgi:hypothetical protein